MPTLNSSQEKESHRNPAGPYLPAGQRLTELPPGTHARMVSFAPGIPGDRKAQLQAYGVIPGNSLWIRQQKPVTVIQVDHTELAFESELAESIYLEKL